MAYTISCKITMSGTTAEAQDQVEGRFLLDVVVRKCAAILQLFACKNQALLIRWNAFLVLDFCLDIVDRIAGLNVERDSLAREGLDEDLHSTTEAQHQVECGLLLDIVVR